MFISGNDVIPTLTGATAGPGNSTGGGSYGEERGSQSFYQEYTMAGASDVVATYASAQGGTYMWVSLQPMAGSGAGGSSTLAADTDVQITTPTNGQVLTYNSTASKWENATPSGGGGGGGGALLAPQYELGPFAPPLAAWFNTTGSSTTPTLVGPTDVAEQGMSFAAHGFNSDDQSALVGRNPVEWGSTWAVTARLVTGLDPSQYPNFGLFLMDTSGKVTEVIIMNVNGIPTIRVANLNNTSGGGYNSNLFTPTPVGETPKWFRIRNDGTDYNFGWSGDGVNWYEMSAAIGAFLGTLASVGVTMCGNSGGPSGVAKASILCTYYDDPDYPAATHTQATTAALGNLANVTLTSPASGQVLEYNGTDWVNAAPSGGGGGGALLAPQYELGPFAPPDPSWFTTTPGYSGLTVAAATVASRGMTFDISGTNNNNQIACLARDPTGWGSAWAVTARMITSSQAGAYPAIGIAAIDTSGKVQCVQVVNVNGVPTIAFGVEYNNNNNSYNTTPQSTALAGQPTWFRLRMGSGNLYYGFSYDGLFWNEVSYLATEFLGTLAYVALIALPNNNNSISPTSLGMLITYYDDPDYPAATHTQATTANLGDLANVTLTSPANGDVLKWNAAASKWENAPARPAVSSETASYAFALTDEWVRANSASALTFTIPPNASVAFPIGTSIVMDQEGAGQLTVAAGAGVTLQKAGATSNTRAQFSVLAITQLATDIWMLTGDTA